MRHSRSDTRAPANPIANTAASSANRPCGIFGLFALQALRRWIGQYSSESYLNVWLLRQPFIPDRRSLVLAYLFPIAFSLHLLEEFVLPGKGEDWFRLYRPRFADRYTEAYFFKVNAIGFAGAALVPLGLFDYRGGYSLGGIFGNMIFASTLLANAYYRVRGSIETKRYSPGTITGVVLYIPLAVTFYANCCGRKQPISLRRSSALALDHKCSA